MKMNAQVVLDAIDAEIDAEFAKEVGFRSHLGGSLIGRPCKRELWYSFRHTLRPSFEARILRLFQRGHNEEFSFVKYLRDIGAEVQDYAERLWYHDGSDSYLTTEWEDTNVPNDGGDVLDDVSDSMFHIQRAVERGVELKQWRISDINGHLGGSLDGRARGLPGVAKYGLTADDWVLLEFKTHSEKSFLKLQSGVRHAKPEHWTQMQIYMHKMGIKLALYMAVNKNNDALYCEYVVYDPIAGAEILAKADEVINAKTIPARLEKRPTASACRFCDFKEQCFMAAPIGTGCRTCQHATPVAKGKWHCSKWDAEIPTLEAQLKGCPEHKVITD